MPDDYGSAKEFFTDSHKYGFDEGRLVRAIKKWLRTPDQKAWMDREDISIEDVLNGRWEVTAEREAYVAQMFADWNEKIGFTSFGG